MILNDYGVFLLEANRLPESERLFRKSIEIRPDYADALLNLGRSLLRQGRLSEVEQPLLKSLRFNPRSVEALYNLGMLYLRLDAPELLEPGRQSLEKAVALNPKHEQAWAGLVRSYEKFNDDEIGERALARAEKHIPHGLDLAVIRATILLRQGKKDGVPAILAQVSQKLKDPATVHPATLNDLAKAYDETGDPVAAMHWFAISSEAKKIVVTPVTVSATMLSLRRSTGYRKSLSSYKNWRPAPPPADGFSDAGFSGRVSAFRHHAAGPDILRPFGDRSGGGKTGAQGC